MTKFQRLQKNMRFSRYRRIPNDYFTRSGLIGNDGQQSDQLPVAIKPMSGVKYSQVYSSKPFLIELLRSNKPLKRINSRFGRLDNETDQSNENNTFPHEFKDAVLSKFRKSDKLALSLFRTIGALDQEIRSLKGIISQSSTQDTSIAKKTFDIDSMTSRFVRELEKMAINPVYTTPAFIYILDDPREIDIVLETVRLMARLVKGGLRAIGLDVETGARQHYSSFPSILQISINKDIVIIFQVSCKSKST